MSDFWAIFTLGYTIGVVSCVFLALCVVGGYILYLTWRKPTSRRHKR